MNASRLALALTGTLSALVLTACSSPVDSIHPTTAPSGDAAPAPAPSADDADSSDGSGIGSAQVAKIGDTARMSNGVEVTVKKVKSIKLSEIGSADDCKAGDPVRVYSVRVKNGSSEPIDPSVDFQDTLTYQDKNGDDQTAPAVFDGGDYNGGYELGGWNDVPSLTAGRTTKFNVGFCVPNKQSTVTYVIVAGYGADSGLSVGFHG